MVYGFIAKTVNNLLGHFHYIPLCTQFVHRKAHLFILNGNHCFVILFTTTASLPKWFGFIRLIKSIQLSMKRGANGTKRTSIQTGRQNDDAIHCNAKPTHHSFIQYVCQIYRDAQMWKNFEPICGSFNPSNKQ